MKNGAEIKPCEIRKEICRRSNTPHYPVIYQVVKLLHRIAEFLLLPYVLTQKDEANQALL